MTSEKRKYVVALFIAMVLGLLFELIPIFLFVVLITYVLSVPGLLKNQKKTLFEKQRFNDINTYMSQMAQSFVHTQDIIQSLKETTSCFSNGHMHDVLNEAMEILEVGKWDINRAERDALSYIEAYYDCEKLKNLHSYFLRAEELGGECKKEFYILESMRLAWQGAIENIRLRRVIERNTGAMIYGFFLFVCVIMLRIMRGSDLDIVTLLPTQIISTVMICGLVLYVVFMDKRLGKSLLETSSVMSETQAEDYFDYFEAYDEKKERKKYAPYAVLSLVAAVLFWYNKPDAITLAISICIVLIGFHIHFIVYMSARHTIQAEIAKAFPKWLFDVMLLLQRESVEGAIEKSLESVPPVLKREVTQMSEWLSLKPHDPMAYMSFLKEFEDQNRSEIMHKLYSLAVGANRDSEVLDVVMEKNIIYMERAERDSMVFRDSMKSFLWIPFLCTGFGCVGYLVIAIMTSVSGIIELIGR